MKTIESTNGSASKKKIVNIKLDDPNLSAMADLTLTIEGTSSLIMHQFSEKVKNQILDKHMGGAQGKKPAKKPEREFLDAMHIIGVRPKDASDLKKTRFGFPAVAFKAAAVRMAKLDGFAMADARCMFFVQADHGELIEIKAPKAPEMRTDPVRIQNTVDIRVRPEFKEWSAVLRVIYNSRLISAKQLTSLFINAGVANGIGEGRPGGRQSSGIFGTWKVVRAEAMEPELDVALRVERKGAGNGEGAANEEV